jgi:hypothetical protein
MTTKAIRVTLTIVAILVAAAHVIWPQVRIDAITVTLLAISVLPWLGHLFRAIELPGGFKVEYRELLQAQQKATDAALLAPVGERQAATRHVYAFESVAGTDSNLALAGLRIEIESRLRELANARNIAPKEMSVRTLTNELTARGVLTEKEAAVVYDLLPILNRAAHGASVDERAKIGYWRLEPESWTPLKIRKVS